VERSQDITRLLVAWREGDRSALDRLVPLVYAQLRRIAANYMRHEAPGHTLQATALVNQAWLRLLEGTGAGWQDRGHFFAVASQVMRRLLVDAARARLAGKRRTGLHHVQLDDSLDVAPQRDAELVALDDALGALARVAPRQARVIEMRFFTGLGVDETAAAVGVSPQTVMRDWKLARAWLKREMKRGG
jgi:RNA polymerase sigma-70 factor, ECF subfamily